MQATNDEALCACQCISGELQVRRERPGNTSTLVLGWFCLSAAPPAWSQTAVEAVHQDTKRSFEEHARDLEAPASRRRFRRRLDWPRRLTSHFDDSKVMRRDRTGTNFGYDSRRAKSSHLRKRDAYPSVTVIDCAMLGKLPKNRLIAESVASRWSRWGACRQSSRRTADAEGILR